MKGELGFQDEIFGIGNILHHKSRSKDTICLILLPLNQRTGCKRLNVLDLPLNWLFDVLLSL